MEALSIETSRLQIRWLDLDDAEFIYTLVNDPDWMRFIGDKGVRNLDHARDYLETGPMAMYRDHGFGLNRVALKKQRTSHRHLRHFAAQIAARARPRFRIPA